jgi:Domain of unknown function (DUF929)
MSDAPSPSSSPSPPKRPGRTSAARRPSARQEQNERLRQQRKAVQKALRPWWQSPLVLAGGAVAVVVIVVVVTFVGAALGRHAGGGGTSQGPSPVPPAVLRAVTHPDPTVAAAVGTGGLDPELTRVAGTQVLRGAGDRPTVVYAGAEYCPYCAAERWSLVMALSSFGTFSGLEQTSSSSTDVYPDTPTFTFVHSSYSSPWVDFQSAELQDRNGQPLQSPSAQISGLLDTVDRPPYTASPQGFPFLDIAGRFVLSQTGFSPHVLQGLSMTQIAADLADPGSPVARAIVGHANHLTAAICSATDNRPAVCSSSTIRGIEATLAALPAAGG